MPAGIPIRTYHMNKTWIFIGNGLLLLLIVYLKYFNPSTAALMDEHPQLHPVLLFLLFYIAVNITSNAAKYVYSKKNKIPKPNQILFSK